MRKIVVVNGSGGSGKDTVVDFAMEILKESNIDRCSSVDIVKEIAKLFGWDGTKDDKTRKLISDLKDIWTEYNNGPFEYIRDRYETVNSDILFVFVREPNEIQKLVDSYGDYVITLLIRRPNIETFNNHADMKVEEYNYDYIIENDGTFDDLKHNIKLFLKDIGF